MFLFSSAFCSFPIFLFFPFLSLFNGRLWLCHNELQNIEDMSSIAKSINLKEITIENNPISLAGDCVSFLVSYLPLLNSLNQLQITEQVRRAANAWRRSKENTDQNFQHLSTDVSSSIRREEIISNARTNWELIRQANIINGSQRQSNHIKKPIKPPKLTQNNSSSSTSTTSSSNMESGKAKNPSRPMIDVGKRLRPKLVKSSSAENSSTIASEKETDGECDFFHLPPVLGQFTDVHNKNPSAASSTRPNVDSESSAFSSDTEEQKSFRSKVPTTPPIHPVGAISKPSSPIEIVIVENGNGEVVDDEKTSFTPPLPSIQLEPVAPNVLVIESNCDDEPTTMTTVMDEPRSPSPMIVPKEKEKEKEKEKATLTIIDSCNGMSLQPTINIESEPPNPPSEVRSEPIEADKLSTISKTSAKTSSDSINTLSSANEERERQVHSSHTNHHPRSRSGARKLGPPLVRSQTARNLSSHLNNQQTGANNQGATQKKEPKKETDKDREQGELEIFFEGTEGDFPELN